MGVGLPHRTTQEAELFRKVHSDFVSRCSRNPTVGELQQLVSPERSEAGLEGPATRKKFEARLSRARKALARLEPDSSPALPIELPHRSGVYDVHLRKVYSDLTQLFPTQPHIALVQKELSRQGIGNLSQDALRDRLKRVGLPFQEEARFRQEVILQAARKHKQQTTEPLKFSSLKKRLEAKGLKLSEKEISRAIYALRRRSGDDIKDLVGLTRERRKAIYTTRQQLVYGSYRSLRSSGNGTVTYAALEKELLRLPSNSHGLSRNGIRRRDQVIKSIKQINRRVGESEKIILAPDQKTLQRDEKVKAGATEYIQKNQGVIDIPGFKAFLAATRKLNLRPGQIRASLNRLEEKEGGGAPRWPTAPYQSKVRNIDIVAAHEKASAMLSKVGATRPPSLKEVQSELAKDGLTISRSAIRGRLEGINAWRRSRESKPGETPTALNYSIHTELRPYAILQAHKELSKAGGGDSPTRAAVAEKATELLGAPVTHAQVEAYRAPRRIQEGGRDRKLWRNLSEIKFTQPRRSGLSVEKLDRYIKGYQEKYKAPPTCSEVMAVLEGKGVHLTRQHISEVVRSLGHSLAHSRAHQAQIVCKKAVDSFRKRCKRSPMVDDVMEEAKQISALPLSRAQVFVALRAVRRDVSSSNRANYALEQRDLTKMLIRKLDALARRGVPPSLTNIKMALGVSGKAVEELVRKHNVARAAAGREHVVLEGASICEERSMLCHYMTRIRALEEMRRDDKKHSGGVEQATENQDYSKAIQRLHEAAARYEIAQLPHPDEFKSHQSSNLLLRLALNAAFVVINDTGLREVNDKHKEALKNAEQRFDARMKGLYGPYYPLKGYPKVLLQALYQGRVDLQTCQEIWQSLLSPTSSLAEIERTASQVLSEICRKAGFLSLSR